MRFNNKRYIDNVDNTLYTGPYIYYIIWIKQWQIIALNYVCRAYEGVIQSVHRYVIRESMKGPIALAIDVLLYIFLLLWEYFEIFLVYLEK